jgi:cytochrome c biogenesis protein CcmG, thiol:disulfide interchange protein DsbE
MVNFIKGLIILSLFSIIGCQQDANLSDISETQTSVSQRSTEVAIKQTISALDSTKTALVPTTTPTLTTTSTITLTITFTPTQTMTPAPICIYPYCAAPNFSLRTIDGNTISLQDLRGKFVVLNFWATWCGPCKAETPLLQKLFEKYKDDGVIVIGINRNESSVELRAFIEKYNMTYPILLDPGEKVSVDLYETDSIPRTFFIDENGIIRDSTLGMLVALSTESKIQELLKRTLWATPTPIPDSN